MHIHFGTLFYQNFFSTGNAGNTIQLDSYLSTLITGKNGGGKSTFIDALTYVLFNKPHRDVNLPTLINTINNKKLLVSVTFTIGTNHFKVVRGQKPSIFEIYKNDELIESTALKVDYQEYLEKSILGLDFKTFTSLVIIGKASYQPFMKLSPAKRKDIIEDFLSIRIFTTMADVLKTQISANKDALKDAETAITVAKTKLDSKAAFVKALSDDNSRKIEENREQITSTFSKIQSLETVVEKQQSEIKKLKETISDKSTVEDTIQELKSIKTKLKYKLDDNQKDIDFFQDHSDCPTCRQEIPNDFRLKKLSEDEARKEKMIGDLSALEAKLEQSNSRIAQIREVNLNITDINQNVAELQQEIASEQKFLSKLQKEISEIQDKASRIQEEKDALKLLINDVQSSMNKKSSLSSEAEYLALCQKMLKDSGIKTAITKKYVPIINKLTAKYLDRLDFFTTFELDENFNEKILARDRDNFSYNLFSVGEQAKIDLALLFTWVKICGLQNSVSCNIIVFDETLDQGVDTDTSGMIVELLKEEFEKKNVIVVSHYPHLYETQFENHVKFKKLNNFSIIED